MPEVDDELREAWRRRGRLHEQRWTHASSEDRTFMPRMDWYPAWMDPSTYRQPIHALHGQTIRRQTSAHCIWWILQRSRQPMQQLCCSGITPSFSRLRRCSIFKDCVPLNRMVDGESKVTSWLAWAKSLNLDPSSGSSTSFSMSPRSSGGARSFREARWDNIPYA
jgi:hypothetical protein